MCQDAIYYSGTQLWSHYDSDVSSNTLSFDLFTYQTNDQVKLQNLKFKLQIFGKSSTCSSATLCSSELYKYSYILKKTILDKINNYISRINDDKSFTEGFVHKCYKNNIYTTILYNSLLGSPCIRLMIGEKERSLLDTDKVYIPLIEFTSFYLTLNKAFDNYCQMSCNLMFLDMMKKHSENIDEKLDSINHKIMELSNIKINTVNVESSNNILDNINIEVPISKSEMEHDDLDVKTSEFDKFLEDNVDKMELDGIKPEKDSKTEKDIVKENIFESQIFKKNFKNLETVILNCVNSSLPLDSFVNTVYTTSSFNLYDGISDIDKFSLNYVITQMLKNNVNRYINNKIELPKYTLPVIVNENSLDLNITQKKIDCMYFLLMSYIYLNRVSNSLSEKTNNAIENKKFLTYCIKTITSPFVFTHLPKIQKDVIKSTVVRLYYELKENGFFKKYEDEIYEKNRIEIDIDKNHISDSIDKIYDNVIKLKDKITVSNFFDLNKNLVLKYKDFEDIKDVKYSASIVEKICLIESGKNNPMEQLKSWDDVPQSILLKYNIKSQKFDNSILVKYIQQNFKDFKDLEQIKNINKNVYDVIDTIDIKSYPLEILKCLYFWNIDNLDRNITYTDFCKLVKSSNLNESQLISMILDNRYKKDNDFFKSLDMISNER